VHPVVTQMVTHRPQSLSSSQIAAVLKTGSGRQGHSWVRIPPPPLGLRQRARLSRRPLRCPLRLDFEGAVAEARPSLHCLHLSGSCRALWLPCRLLGVGPPLQAGGFGSAINRAAASRRQRYPALPPASTEMTSENPIATSNGLAHNITAPASTRGITRPK
jgi:hypothetical protein